MTRKIRRIDYASKSRRTCLRSDVWENRRAPSASCPSLGNPWAMAQPAPRASWKVLRRRGLSSPENPRKRSARLIEMSLVRRNRPQDSLTYVGLREHHYVCNIETLKSVNGHVDLTRATSCTAKVLPWMYESPRDISSSSSTEGTLAKQHLSNYDIELKY